MTKYLFVIYGVRVATELNYFFENNKSTSYKTKIIISEFKD